MAKIVVCEDEPIAQKVIVAMLRGSGHELYTADDGLQGLELVERERPALLVTDVSMPGLTGLELADAVRARPALQHVRVILVSAFAQRTEIEEGCRHGVADYITKPFKASEFRARIERVLRGET
jgi:CheY-like chemotaxis protein